MPKCQNVEEFFFCRLSFYHCKFQSSSNQSLTVNRTVNEALVRLSTSSECLRLHHQTNVVYTSSDNQYLHLDICLKNLGLHLCTYFRGESVERLFTRRIGWHVQWCLKTSSPWETLFQHAAHYLPDLLFNILVSGSLTKSKWTVRGREEKSA